jgi:hypothetical protein
MIMSFGAAKCCGETKEKKKFMDMETSTKRVSFELRETRENGVSVTISFVHQIPSSVQSVRG